MGEIVNHIAGVGSEAMVKKCTGQYSRRFIGQIGFAVRSLNSTGRQYWVLRFASARFIMEEGLFEESELTWTN